MFRCDRITLHHLARACSGSVFERYPQHWPDHDDEFHWPTPAPDPERQFATVNCRIAKGSFAEDVGGLGQIGCGAQNEIHGISAGNPVPIIRASRPRT